MKPLLAGLPKKLPDENEAIEEIEMAPPVNGVKLLVERGQLGFGTFAYSPDPAITEMIGAAGFDFVIIDTEHASLDRKDVEQLARAALAGGATPFVRVRDQDPQLVGQALDAGAAGVVIPHLKDAATAREMVRAASYPPQGTRGACTTSRATGYATRPFADYVAISDAQTWVIAQIEDPEGVSQVSQIAAAGVNALMPGPSDLAAAFGVPGQFLHPQVLEAVGRIVSAGDGAVPTFMYINDPSEASEWIARGVRLLIYSIDYKVTARAYLSAMQEFKRLAPLPAATHGAANR